MPTIKLSTFINASIEECFDLARSIDMHVISTKHTGEQAIAGRVSGLIGPNETVTWRARHFGIWQTLTSKITQFDYPNSFTDEMVNGAFKSFKHQHLFFEHNGQTEMKDVFEFESPCGIIGRFANFLFLKRYMENLLIKRNAAVREVAETNK